MTNIDEAVGKRGVRPRILFDLSVAAGGYAGIPQDTRSCYALFRQSDAVETSGLIYPLGMWTPTRFHGKSPPSPAQISSVLHATAFPEGPPVGGRLSVLTRRIKRLREWADKRSHPVVEVPKWLATDALWRVLFQKNLPSSDREHILDGRFFVTDWSLGALVRRSQALPFLPDKRLEVVDHDVLWLSMPRPIAVPKSVVKVVRYHDTIPLTQPDTVVNANAANEHYRGLKSCSGDSVFVCTSPFSRESLVHLVPESDEAAVIIPCTVPIPHGTQRGLTTSDVIARRLSFRALGSGENGSVMPGAFARAAPEPPRFIASVGTLEPRKNLAMVVQAWERLRVRVGEDIKLVLVANEGWGDNEATLRAMEPHVRNGNLFHLRGLSPEELQLVVREALFSVFLPFDEGFGLPPLESLAVGTPVLASDIPVLRWTLGDAAVFADPYDTTAVVDAMERLLHADPALRFSMQDEATRQLIRFSPGTVRALWEDFF